MDANTPVNTDNNQPNSNQTTQPPAGPAPQATPPATQDTGLDFVPESLRGEGWVSKYKTKEDFWKGVDSTIKMVGQKQVVNGLQVPGDQATDEDWNNFFAKSGRPETADKYALPDDIKGPEGIDWEAEKSQVKAIAHKAGLNQKQAATLFKEYAATLNQQFQAQNIPIEQVIKTAFKENPEANYELAKKAMETYGIGDSLKAEGLDKHPLILRMCATLGEQVGEGVIRRDDGGGDTKASILDEAKRIMASEAYQNGDKSLHDKVYKMMQQVYG